MGKAKKVFSAAESAAVWLAYEGICTLCETPIVDLRSNTVDHVLPENLQNEPSEFEAVKKFYGLPDDFDLNDFPNWVPAHPKCNSRKGETILEGPQAMGMIIARAKRMGERARTMHARMIREREFAAVVAQLDMQINAGLASIDQLVVLRALIEKAEGSSHPEAQLLVDYNIWKVVVIKPWGLAIVSNGKVLGDTPVRTAPSDLKELWLCEKCNGYGPWHLDMESYDFMCLTCGHVSGFRHIPAY